MARGLPAALRDAEKSPVLVRRNDKPVAWIVSAQDVARAAHGVSPDDPQFVRHVLKVIAVRLFDEETLTLGQAARLAGLSVADFVTLADRFGVAVLREPIGGLAREVDAVEAWLESMGASANP